MFAKPIFSSHVVDIWCFHHLFFYFFYHRFILFFAVFFIQNGILAFFEPDTAEAVAGTGAGIAVKKIVRSGPALGAKGKAGGIDTTVLGLVYQFRVVAPLPVISTILRVKNRVQIFAIPDIYAIERLMDIFTIGKPITRNILGFYGVYGFLGK